jgi:hypothetical protein
VLPRLEDCLIRHWAERAPGPAVRADERLFLVPRAGHDSVPTARPEANPREAEQLQGRRSGQDVPTSSPDLPGRTVPGAVHDSRDIQIARVFTAVFGDWSSRS